MPLPNGFTGRACNWDDGLVHAIRSFLLREIQAPGQVLAAACCVGVFSLEVYCDPRPVTCLACVCLPTGVDDALE